MFISNIERGARSECVILRNMLSNEAVNASRMIDMHVSVYEAKCDNPLAHIHVRIARGEISRYWSSYIKLNYLLSSDSIHFLVFSSCEMQDCQLASRHIFTSNYIISSSISFRVRKINIFTSTRHNIENNEHALFPTDNHWYIYHNDFFVEQRYAYIYPISFCHSCGQTFQQQIILVFRKCGSRKLINPIGRISERVLHTSWKAMTRTYLGTAESFRSIAEKNENTGRIPEQREKVGRKEMHGARRRENETREGEGDATRLINRHADNHSGFMVTTDYQVVQGDIFHIRDVTLFQWGNTCFARYKTA